MRKKRRGEERDTTTHLIEIMFLLTLVVLLNFSMCISKTEIEKDGVVTCTT